MPRTPPAAVCLFALTLAGCGPTYPTVTGTATPAVNAVAFSPDGSALAANLSDVVKVWDSAGWSVKRTLKAPSEVTALAWAPDCKRLAVACGSEKAAVVWGPEGDDPQARLTGFKAPPTAIAWSPLGDLLVVAAGDPNPYADRRNNVRSEVRLFDPAGTAVGELSDPGDTVLAIAFAPDGKRFVTGSFDGRFRVWDAATRKPVGPPLLHSDRRAMLAAAFSSDGGTLLTAGVDNTVAVWDAATWKEKGRLTGHTDRINAVAAGPAGVVSGSDDGSVRLWDVDKLAPKGVLLASGPRVYGVAASRDGKAVAAGGVGGVVHVWDPAAPGTLWHELK